MNIIKFIIGIIVAAAILYSYNAKAQMNPEYQTTYETPEYIRESPEYRK